MAGVQSAAVSAGGGASHLTEENAVEFLIGVKNTLEDQDKYDELEKVMKDLHYKRIGPLEMMEKAKVLLKGHEGRLLLGFNQWIPERYRSPIAVSKQMIAKNQDLLERYNRAKAYVQKVRTRFENQYHVYIAFCRIVNVYMKRGLPDQEIHRKVSHLFSQHADLLEDFSYFLRDKGQVSNITAIKPAAANLASRSEGETTTGTRSQQAGQRVEAERKRKGKGKMDDSIQAMTGNEAATKDTENDCKFKTLVVCQTTLSCTRQSARRVDWLIRKQHEDWEDEEEFQYQSPPRNDDKDLQNERKAQVFFENVKERLWNRELYEEFLKCVNMFSKEIITSSELQSLVVEILGLYPDLMAELDDLLCSSQNLNCYFSSEKIDLRDSTTPAKTPSRVQKNQQHERKEQDCDQEDHIAQDQRPLRKRKRDGLAGVAAQSDVPGRKASPISSKIKTLKKRTSHLDISQWESCTPGYRLRPKDYPTPLCTQQTELDREVLNDCCESVPVENGDSNSSKHMEKNRHQKILFNCEDDRTELYVLLESKLATARRVNELVAYIQNPEFKESLSTFVLDDHLSAINFRCIRRVYEDHGVDIIDDIRKNPSTTLPSVLRRLRQKHHELSQHRIEMDRVWAMVQLKNYSKSLGHRSVKFKHQNKERLSACSI